MIIRLDFEEGMLAQIDMVLLEERVSLILRAHSQGIHLVTISRAAGRWIEGNVQLNQKDRSTLKRLIDEIAQSGGLIRQAPRFLRIGMPKTLLQLEKGGAIGLPIDHDLFDRILGRPAFVVEDSQSDGKVYKLVLEKRALKRLGLRSAFETYHGGGQRSLEVASDTARDGRIVYIVLDADKLTPVSPELKREKLREMHTRAQKPPLLFFDVTPCRELENIFSPDVLSHIAKSDPQRDTLCKLVEIDKIEKANGVTQQERHWLHFDFKSGLSKMAYDRSSKKEREWISEPACYGKIKSRSFAFAGLRELDGAGLFGLSGMRESIRKSG